MPQPLSATAEHERIWQLDVLRGFAMVGILYSIANDFGWSLPFSSDFFQNPGLADRVWWVLHDTFIGQRSIAILSLLYGIGIGQQSVRWQERGHSAWPFFLRRMGTLAFFGVINTTFFWWGEILLVYAVFGMIAFGLSKLPSRVMLFLALVVYFVVHTLWEVSVTPLLQDAVEPSFFAKYSYEEMLRIYRSGSFIEMVMARWSEYAMLFPHNNQWMRTSLALILVGVAIGKEHWHVGLLDSPRKWSRFGIAAIIVLMIGTLLSLATGVQFASPMDGAIPFVACSFWILCCVTAYVFLVALACELLGKRPPLTWLSNFGRMALTNYLFAALVYSCIYTNNGWGMYGTLAGWTQIPIASTLLILEVAFCTWWLSRYRMGPMEWLWRRLSYGRRIRIS